MTLLGHKINVYMKYTFGKRFQWRLLEIFCCLLLTSFSIAQKFVRETNAEKNAFFASGLFGKFQNFLTVPSPPRFQGPVLLRPYLNMKPALSPQNGPSQLGRIQEESQSTTTEKPLIYSIPAISENDPHLAKFNLFAQWKKQKKEKIEQLKKELLDITSQESAALSREQEKEIAFIRHQHMHGVVDFYRPPEDHHLGTGWGWKSKAKKKKKTKKKKTKKSKKKKTKKLKKKKSKKKKKKKKSSVTGGGYGWDDEHPLLAYPSSKRKKTAVKTNINSKPIGNWNKGYSSFYKKEDASKHAFNHGSNYQFQSSNAAFSTASRTTDGGYYGYSKLPKSSYKINKKSKTKQKGRKGLKQSKYQRLNDRKFADRLLKVDESKENDVQGGLEKFSKEIYIDSSSEDYRSRTKFLYRSGHIHTSSIPVILQPGLELHFRQMPLIYEDFTDTSIY